MDDATLTLLVLAGTVGLFVLNKLPVSVVALLSALALWATGLAGAAQMVAGFGDPLVIFIASLFVVAEGVDATGVTTWLGQFVITHAGDKRWTLLVALCLLAAVLSTMLTLNGATAALIPLAVMLAIRIGKPPSQMLMPLTFAGGAGSLLIVPGSPVNLIVSEAAAEAGLGQFPLFSFALVGIPVLAGTIAIAIIFGPRLLPRTRPTHQAPNLARHAETLAEQYAQRGGYYRLRIRAGSSLCGIPAAEIDAPHYPGIRVVGAQAADGTVRMSEPLQVGDVLVVAGPRQEVSHLAIDHHLAVSLVASGQEGLLTREAGVAEVIVPPRSSLIGTVVFPGLQRTSDQVLLAVQRNGRTREQPRTKLEAGDTLLVHGSWDALDLLAKDTDVLVVDAPDVVRRQAVALSSGAWPAIGCLALVIALLATGAVPPVIAGVIGAILMIVLRVVPVEKAFRAISWDTIVLIGALVPLTHVIQTSGAADRIGSVLLSAVGGGGPRVLMLAVFILTAVLGQLISNTATALVVTPIAISAATTSGISILPILVVVAVAGCASLLTPISTPGNMMIMGPGGYRFGDYWKLGLPTMLWWLLCAMIIIPLVWHF
ncbi:MAG: SLC13 family permease [Microlunatus sp.]|nr:SLC13 family permease [Microlunatus sp.]